MPTEITFSALLVLGITANACIVVKCKVYKNVHSATIMACLTSVMLIRLMFYIRDMVVVYKANESWVFTRLTQDICNFFLSIMELILLVQWH